MRESKIEKYLVDKVKEYKGEAYKFKSPNRRNVPDRLVLLPRCRPFFIELKATDKKATTAQKREHKKLKKLGYKTYVVNSISRIDPILHFEYVGNSFTVPNLTDYIV